MNRLIALSGALILILFSFEMAIAAGSAPVTVVNTSSNPVPVTGSVGITGTANVNVTNSVPISGSVTLTGTPNVNVSNTPDVRITNTSIPVELQPRKTTTLLAGPKTNDNFGDILDASQCSILRIDVRNDNGVLSISIDDYDPAKGGFSIIHQDVNSGNSAQFIVEVPPPTILVLAQGSTDYWVNIYCR
jgi:hypothetical protein